MRSAALCVLVGAAVVSGCKKSPPDALASVGNAVLDYASPPREVQYERRRVVGQLGVPTQPIRETWTRLDAVDKGAQYRVSVGVVGEPQDRVANLLSYTDAGLLISGEGTYAKDGELVFGTWAPPKTLLPPAPAVGMSWDGQHSLGDLSEYRSCEIMSSKQCDGDGLVVVCDVKRTEFRVVTRDHFCRDVGWSGYESLVVRQGHPDVRTWTEGVRRVD
ncbi:MAG: hypothetical protein AB8H79_02525 [Myxococcota bacterium]